MTNGLTIGAFAKSVGVRADTIRYYERHGLLADPGRTAAGYRIYDARDVERVRFIRKGKHLGFTLKEIGTLLSLHSSDTARAADVLDITQRKNSQPWPNDGKLRTFIQQRQECHSMQLADHS